MEIFFTTRAGMQKVRPQPTGIAGETTMLK